MPILVLFILLPLVEIALFVLVGGWIGLWPTLALVVGAVIFGGFLIRRQGVATVRQVQKAMDTFADPAAPMAHGAMIVLAGILLILPGFLTDALALLLLLPPVRRLILRGLANRVVVAGGYRRGPAAHEDVIDGEATEITPDPRPLPRNGPSGWTRPPE